MYSSNVPDEGHDVAAGVDRLGLAGVLGEAQRDRLRGDREVQGVEAAGIDDQRVGAGVDPVHVVACAAVERVVAAVGDDRVVAGPADQAVGPGPGDDQVVARAAEERLVAAVAVELDVDGRGQAAGVDHVVRAVDLRDDLVGAGGGSARDRAAALGDRDGGRGDRGGRIALEDKHDLGAVAAGAAVAIGRRRGRDQHADRVRGVEREVRAGPRLDHGPVLCQRPGHGLGVEDPRIGHDRSSG